MDDCWSQRPFTGIVGNVNFAGIVEEGQQAGACSGHFGSATTVEDHASNVVSHKSSTNPGTYVVSGRAAPSAGFVHCQACDFMDWGWWGTRVRTDDNGPTTQTSNRSDYVHMGTWVAGDITQYADLPTTGSATYNGTTLGTVKTSADKVYLAKGGFNMTFDFASRNGTASITNFDGMNATGSVIDATGSNGEALVRGALIGGPDTAVIRGAFTNDGPVIAKGVIGQFEITGTGKVGYGTFMGTR